jgi:FAD dependent oxidoreductase TIGR03364
MATFDLVVVGAGIVGLAHALAGARRGMRVAVLERDARASMASVRNFGFVTVTGQDEGATRRRALRSREVWAEVAAAAGIEIHQRGAVVVARRPEAFAVLREYAAGSMGEGCELWDAGETIARMPQVRQGIAGALSSRHELRVEAREALPLLARWLEQAHGVTFLWGATALGIEGTSVRHGEGVVEGRAVVIAPGTAVAAFAPELAQRVRLRDCTLQMMRIASPGADFRLPSVVMTDLSLLRYGGFAAQPSAAALRERATRECSAQLAAGVHLIVAAGGDGTLVVGDSHRYGNLADPFSSSEVDELILGELQRLMHVPAPRIMQRWLGHYPVADVSPLLSEELAPRVRLVSVTSGTGMSTAFAIGEETLEWLEGFDFPTRV